MVKTLRGVEDKLRSLITNMSGNDEVMMSYCLELNDDLMKVHFLYILLNRHLNDMKQLRNIGNLYLLRLNNFLLVIKDSSNNKSHKVNNNL